MTNQIQAFNFTQAEVRTSKDKNGEPLFCLSDVAKILDIQNSRQIVQKQLDSKGVYKIYIPTNSGNQDVTFISEPNLYRVIFRSNKPDAVKFQNWIFEEVIPQIRKTGSYSTTNNKTALEALDMITPEVCYNLNMSKATWLGGIKAMAGVESLEDLTSEQIAEAIAHALIQVVDKIKKDNEPISADFEQIDYLPGHMRLVCEPSASLHDMMKKVASCYLDSDAAFRNIMMQLEKDCKLHNLSWINYERLGTALRSLANFSDEAFKHKKMLAQIDSNAITSMAVSYGLPAVCYNKAV